MSKAISEIIELIGGAIEIFQEAAKELKEIKKKLQDNPQIDTSASDAVEREHGGTSATTTLYGGIALDGREGLWRKNPDGTFTRVSKEVL